MSGSRIQHLERRNGTFYLRVRVPDVIRLLIELTEVRRSLKTHDPLKARALAATYAARLLRVFAMLKTKEFTRDNAIGLVQRCFADLRKEVEEPAPLDWHSPQLDIEEQRFFRTAAIATLSRQRTAQNFEPSGDPEFCILPLAHTLAAEAGYSFDQLPVARQLDLMDGVARAVIEQQRLALHRADDRLAPYHAVDPLFAGEINFTGQPLIGSGIAPTPHLGPTLGVVIDKYLEAGRKRWVTKTVASRKVRLGYLRQHLGEDRPIESITAHDVRGFRDAVCRLRARRGSADQSFFEKQTSTESQRVTLKTASLVFEDSKSFFSWAKSHEGYIETNPAADIRIASGKAPKAEWRRRPMTADELTTLFSSAVFTGCKSLRRRFVRGTEIIQDGR